MSGKVAVITGAGSGIGRATALALQAEGFDVVLAGRRTQELQRTADLMSSSPGVLLVTTDVSRPESVKSLFRKVKQHFGRIDVLFNNAGTSVPAIPIEDISYDDWSRVVAVNITGVFLCAQEAVRLMKEQKPRGGRIINNGSVSAHVPRPNSVPYTATKHAVTGITKSISLDGRASDIVCGQIDIGNAETEMTSVMKIGVPQANGTIMPEPQIDLRCVTEAIVYMASLPLDANVQFITVMASKMPFIGRG